MMYLCTLYIPSSVAAHSNKTLLFESILTYKKDRGRTAANTKERNATHAPTMLTLPSLSGFPRHFTLPARS